MISDKDISVDSKVCPLCGKPNGCPMADNTKGDDIPCWCSTLNIPARLLARVPERVRNCACICRDCIDRYDIGD